MTGDDHSYDVKVDGDGFIYVTGFCSGLAVLILVEVQLLLTNPNWADSCQPAGYIGKVGCSLGNFSLG